LRRIPSRCANWLMAKLSGVDIHDFGTTFKAYRREILEQVPLYGELHRFIPALASWHGASIIEVPIKNVNRQRGASHYGISRTFPVFLCPDSVRLPLRFPGPPAHFLRPVGIGNIFSRSRVCCLVGLRKIVAQTDVMVKHGPLMLFSAVL